MVFAVLAVLIGFGLAAFGWGRAFQRLARLSPGSWPVMACLGLGVIVFLGGILNLFVIAYPAMLAVLVVAGLGLAAWQARGAGTPQVSGWSWRGALPVGLALALTGIVAALLLPPAAYNFGDDFQKYFAYPVRMIETGTVTGSSLNSMGAETLGATAFLDGFLIAIFSPAYLYAVDGVFGFGLCLLLLASAVRQDFAIAGALAVLSLAVIDPQIVNISPVYLGAALMMAAILVARAEPSQGKSAAIAILLAALIAMKPSFVLFAVLFLIFTSIAEGLVQKSFQRGLVFLVGTTTFTLLFLTPWLLLHRDLMAGALHRPITPRPITEHFSLFAVAPLTYGSTMLQYTLAVLAGVAAAGFAAWKRQSGSAVILGAAATGLGAYLVLLFWGAPALTGYQTSLRYFTPFALAILPLVCLYAGTELVGIGWRKTLPMVFAALPALIFLPSAPTRVAQMARDHTSLAFFHKADVPSYLDYNRKTLWGDEAERIATLQALIPAGEPITAWINQPFLLDYARNPIQDVNAAGLAAPWASMPQDGYVIWEFLGYASPHFAEDEDHIVEAGAHEWLIDARSLQFAKHLRELSTHAQALYNDGHIAVFKLGKEPVEMGL